MKKTLTIFFVIMILFTLIGCNPGRKIIGGGSDGAELVYYVWGNNLEIQAIQDVIDLFEVENPDINIRIERAGDNYFNDLKLKFSVGKGPDIFLMDPGEIGDFLKEDFILPLDSYINNSDLLSFDDLWDVNDGYRYDGSNLGSGDLYALIKDWSPDFMLIYNKNQVEQYEQTNPSSFPYLNDEEPMTWSQFKEFAEKMTIGSGPSISRYGTTMDFVPIKHLFEWVQMTGDTMFINDDRNFNKDGEGVKEAFEFFVSLQEGANAPAPYKGATSLAVGGERFSLKTVSSVFLGRWAFVAYNWDKVDFEIGILPPPVPESRIKDSNGKRIPYAGVSGMIANAINKDTRYPDEAYKFVEFYQTVGMEQLAQIGYNIPGNKTIAENIFLSVENEKIREINEMFLEAATNYSNPIVYNKHLSTTTIERLISLNINLYFEKREGITSVEALLNKISQDLDRELAKI